MRYRRSLVVPLLLIVGFLANACEEDSPTSVKKRDSVSLSAEAAPDFRLIDVNPNSPRHDQLVSPRDYVQRVSAWYFGHAT
jgi:hypothetical protein